MTTYSLSEIIFRTHQLTQTRTRLCPECLTENHIELTICPRCDLNIPNYTEETFISERFKHISGDTKNEIGLGIGNELEKSKKQREKFNSQYELWDEYIVKTAKFIKQFTVSPQNPLDYAQVFLRYFPMSSQALDKMKLGHIDILLETYNSTDIQKKLLDIEHRGNPQLFTDFAIWDHVYVNEGTYPLILQNMRWLNVIPGFYVDYQGMDIGINENNPDHIREAINYVPRIDPTPFSIEIMLYPLHWKILMEEKLYPSNKPCVSKPRYQIVMEQWIPATKAQVAWRDLGILYCKNGAGNLSEEMKSYRDLQVSLSFGDKDLNFLYSLAVITNTANEDILNFSQLKDSYFAPLISLNKNVNYLRDFFLNSTNRESWLRALHFFDFSLVDFHSEVALKILTELSDDEYSRYLNLLHPSLHGPLFKHLIVSKFPKKISSLLQIYQGWEVELQYVNLNSLYKNDASILTLLLDKTLDTYKWPSNEIIFVLKEFPENPDLVNTLLRVLENSVTKSPEFIGELYDLWCENKKKQHEKVAEKYLDRMYSFIGNKNPFYVEEGEKLTDLKRKLINSLSSKDISSVKLAEEFIDARVNPSGVKLASLITEYSPEEILLIFKDVLKNSKYRGTKNIAFNFVSALVESNKLSTQNLQSLMDELPSM
ncbi:MAG: hypothetical protein K2Q18_02565, partial [Bdellovibrionales bacterium]|nr:hypothetical protein [Bdellovibrionales bacterium]